ncbi:MAG: endonuclease/exonuclease/phosphatase family protein [Flavobacteriaceae bacterium]|nr:endonuclease/exonuclease/phosphatase family protein [Flavobacteriaceae bacterium]
MKYALILCTLFCFGQKGQVYTFSFYNVENLFDAYDNPNTFDDDYTPEGRLQWTSALMHQKTAQLAAVISQIGLKETQRAPVVIGLAEIENKNVLKSLLQHKSLRPYDYGIIHFQSPDFRGIDVALLYQKNHFLIENQKAIKLELTDPKTGYKRTTHDILVVSGYLAQHRISFLINHWPSRRGGKTKSAPHRMKAALLHKKITDSLMRKYPEGKIISMGDYNDNPNDKSLQWIKGKKKDEILFNPMEKMIRKGIGSLAHNDRWFLFDQLLFSLNWNEDKEIFLLKTAVFNPSFLRTKRSNYHGYPFRTKIHGTRLEGFSDHFPVYTIVGLSL